MGTGDLGETGTLRRRWRQRQPDKCPVVTRKWRLVEAVASFSPRTGRTQVAGVPRAPRSDETRAVQGQGLFLVTPFARLGDVVQMHYPFLPRFILRDRYDPVRDLAGFAAPAVVLVAGRDEVVSAAQGRLLFESLRGPKRLVEQEGATHNGVDLGPGLPLWPEAVAFLLRSGG